jgi:hypothetical protein
MLESEIKAIKTVDRECRQLVFRPGLVAREVSGHLDLLGWGIGWIGHAFTRGYAECASRMFLADPNARS